jgi:hypothetical protein
MHSNRPRHSARHTTRMPQLDWAAGRSVRFQCEQLNWVLSLSTLGAVRPAYVALSYAIA